MDRFKISAVLSVVLLSGIGIGYLLRNTNKSVYNYTKKKTDVDLKSLENKDNIIPIAILGSGPAGLSAAIYGARANIYTVVFQGPKPGGQLTETSYVENWPGTPKMLGVDLINQTQKQAERFGAVMVSEAIEKVDFSSWPFKLYTEEGKELNALSVVIATGSTPIKLGVPGEDTYWGKGVTTCAICDAPYYKNKKVVVAGGGDSAVEEATLLASFASSVTMLVRKDSMRAAPTMQARLKQFNNIKVLYNTEIKEVLGNDQEVTGVKLFNNKTQETYQFPVDGVFLAIGHTPNSGFLNKQVQTTEGGYIVVAPRAQETTQAGVFAAGDVSDPKFKQAGIAAGEGTKAGLGAIEFLAEHDFDESLAQDLEDKFYDPDVETEAAEIRVVNTVEEFKELIENAKIPVFVDFFAPSCIACMQMLPYIASVAAKFADEAVFVKVNRDEAKELAKLLNIKSVPHLVVFKNGKEIARLKSTMTKRHLYNTVNEFIYAESSTN